MKMLKYFPLVKVDELTHSISGIATAEMADKENEICDYEYCKTISYPRWSAEAAESTTSAGQEISYGNIRLQHGVQIIAGKVSSPPVYVDADRAVHITTEPASDDIWAKARKGFIRGFSQGGDYAFRICEVEFQKLKKAGKSSKEAWKSATQIKEGNDCPTCGLSVTVRYGPQIAEVSYVDNPALKVATFTLVKADGQSELCKFVEGASAVAEVPPATEECCGTCGLPVSKCTCGMLSKRKIADGGEKGELMEKTVTEDKVEKTTDTTKTALSAIDMDVLVKSVTDRVLGKTAEKEALAKKEKDKKEAATKAITAIITKTAEKYPGSLRKGMDTVAQLANMLTNLAWMRICVSNEQQNEGDISSTLPADLQTDLESLADTFLAMAEEETRELTASAKEGKGGMYMTEQTGALAKARKSFAEHIAKAKGMVDAHAGAMHAHLDKMHKATVGDGDGISKAADNDELGKKADVADSFSEGVSDEPTSIDPQDKGTSGSMKTATAITVDKASYTKEEVQQLIAQAVEKTANDTAMAIAKALSGDDDDDDSASSMSGISDSVTSDTPPKKKAAGAQEGIGQRGQEVVKANVRVMPVTKEQDGEMGRVTVAVEANDAVTLSKAMSGDMEAQLAFMKGVKSESAVPETLAPTLKLGR